MGGELEELESDADREDTEDSETEDELSFGDNGKPANYIFCACEDADLGYAVAVVPVEYWDTEENQADWELKLEVAGFTQEVDGVFTYDHSDNLQDESALEVLHLKFEKLGCTYSAKLGAFLEELGFEVYKPVTEPVEPAITGPLKTGRLRSDEVTVSSRPKPAGAAVQKNPPTRGKRV